MKLVAHYHFFSSFQKLQKISIIPYECFPVEPLIYIADDPPTFDTMIKSGKAIVIDKFLRKPFNFIK